MHVVRKYNAKPQRICSFFIYFLIKSWLIAKEKAKKISENIKLHVFEWKNFDSFGKF